MTGQILTAHSSDEDAANCGCTLHHADGAHIIVWRPFHAATPLKAIRAHWRTCCNDLARVLNMLGATAQRLEVADISGDVRQRRRAEAAALEAWEREQRLEQE